MKNRKSKVVDSSGKEGFITAKVGLCIYLKKEGINFIDPLMGWLQPKNAAAIAIVIFYFNSPLNEFRSN